MINLSLLLIGAILFLLSHILIFYQINGQFIWEIFQKNIILVSVAGIGISYILIQATKFTVEGFNGLLWPTRFLAFGIGMLVYALLVNYHFSEAITPKVGVSLLLSLILIAVQVLWR